MPKRTNQKAPKKTPAAKTGPAASGKQVTIRMYNVGFGDAFLVLIPDGEQELRVLFDCGSVEAADGEDHIAMKDVVARIVKDVTDADGVPRIDVVVATHRHKDHVSGFGQALWDTVEVKEVWMPWTEHPTDPDARKIREAQSRLALSLNMALAAKPPQAGSRDELARVLVANALMLSNDKAMKTLHSGFLGKIARRFLPEKTEAGIIRTFETPALPSVKIHVMGPQRSTDVIRDMDPPAGKSYLRLQNGSRGTSVEPPAPFSPEFRQTTDPQLLSPDDRAEIERASSLSDLAVAVALDKAVNGTSVMLVLEIAGTFFLFPGDAQWGTWDAAMRDPEWNEMLTRVAFYKIGHHGSHNATPKDFVQHMLPDKITAMASTKTRTIWPDIPRAPLLADLLNHHAIVARSDQEHQADQSFRVDHGMIEARVPL